MEHDLPIADLTCGQTRELLSDYLDVSRGEAPLPEGALADASRRSAVQRHLATCAACRDELAGLAEVGAAYAEFSVGEKSAQEFAGWGYKTRLRMKLSEPVVLPQSSVAPARPKTNWLFWLAALGSSAAAAILAVAVLLPIGAWSRLQNTTAQPNPNPPTPTKTERTTTVFEGNALDSAGRDLRHIETPASPVPFVMLAGPGTNPVRVDPNSSDSADLFRQIDSVLRRGPVKVYETPTHQDAARGLLGVELFLLAEQPAPAEQKAPNGLFVAGIEQGGPAARAGIEPGAYILAVNDLHFSGSTKPEVLKFFSALKQLKAGEKVSVEFSAPDGDQRVIRRALTVLGEYQD